MRQHEFDALYYCVRCDVAAERVRRGEVETVCVGVHLYRDREHPNELIQKLRAAAIRT